MVMTIITGVKKEKSKIIALSVRRYDEIKKQILTLEEIYDFRLDA